MTLKRIQREALGQQNTSTSKLPEEEEAEEERRLEPEALLRSAMAA